MTVENDDVHALGQLGFLPINYTGNVAATTGGVSVAVPADANIASIRARNLDATNFVKIGFGTDATEATTNAANGCAIVASDMEILAMPVGTTHVGLVGDTATVTVNLQFGR